LGGGVREPESAWLGLVRRRSVTVPQRAESFDRLAAESVPPRIGSQYILASPDDRAGP
jgi:hypothetical protein